MVSDIKMEQSTEVVGQPLQGESFLAKLFPFLFGADASEIAKKKLLKQILKWMRRMKPKVYNHRNGTADPALARIFHQFYRTLGPAKLLLRSAEASRLLKDIIIESSLSKDQLRMIENLSEKSICGKAETTELKILAEELKGELKSLFATFTKSALKSLEQQYNLLSMLLNLINFDYYFTLKKFDSKFPEADFAYKPHFDSIDGRYVVDEVKDFLEIMPVVDTNADWNRILDILKEYRQLEVISRSDWSKMLGVMGRFQHSKLLEMMVRLIDRDPFYEPALRTHGEKIVQSYLNRIKAAVSLTLQNVAGEAIKRRIDSLTFKVFDTVDVPRLSGYTAHANEKFTKRDLAGFTHMHGLRCLKAFLLDYCKKDIREIVDLLLIKGKWLVDTTAVSGAIYDAFQHLLHISRELLAFDASLAEEEELGRRIKASLAQCNRIKQNDDSLHKLLKEANDKAKNLIYRGVQNCIVLAQALKSVMEDRGKNSPELITNWRELNSMVEDELKDRISDTYRKIYSFVQLLNMPDSKKAQKREKTDSGGAQ